MSFGPAWAETETLGGYSFTIGTDSEGSYYEVDCPDALTALASYVNAGNGDATEGNTFKQTADITLSGTFPMIGDEYDGKKFKGTYGGGNFTVSGLNVSQTYRSIGFFGRLGANATVKNIRLISPTITATVASTTSAPLITSAIQAQETSVLSAEKTGTKTSPLRTAAITATGISTSSAIITDTLATAPASIS